jgi:hypothetical protein
MSITDAPQQRLAAHRLEYERIAAEVLYENGKSVILQSEQMPDGVKSPEGLLDGKVFDVKGVEGMGKRNLIDKISDAGRQNVETIVLYYHDSIMCDEQKIVNAYNGYRKLSKNSKVKNVLYIVNNELHEVIIQQNQ